MLVARTSRLSLTNSKVSVNTCITSSSSKILVFPARIVCPFMEENERNDGTIIKRKCMTIKLRVTYSNKKIKQNNSIHYFTAIDIKVN